MADISLQFYFSYKNYFEENTFPDSCTVKKVDN
jgi:hypothetical protein